MSDKITILDRSNRRSVINAMNKYTGKTFNDLTILGYDHSEYRETSSGGYTRDFVKCKCSCGKFCIKSLDGVISGHTLSCGHKHIEIAREVGRASKTHGKSADRLYYIWSSMICRCYNPNDSAYDNYGGRGIKVYKKWLRTGKKGNPGFAAFCKWAYKHGYYDQPKGTSRSEMLSIERKDPNGDYTPKNCKWIPIKEQNKNTRNNVWFTDYDDEKLIMVDLARKYNIKRGTIGARLKHGWSKDLIVYQLNHPELKINHGENRDTYKLVDDEGFGRLMPTVETKKKIDKIKKNK
jgi:hypothetical protein